jgi:hypothetical protein
VGAFPAPTRDLTRHRNDHNELMVRTRQHFDLKSEIR